MQRTASHCFLACVERQVVANYLFESACLARAQRSPIVQHHPVRHFIAVPIRLSATSHPLARPRFFFRHHRGPASSMRHQHATWNDADDWFFSGRGRGGGGDPHRNPDGSVCSNPKTVGGQLLARHTHNSPQLAHARQAHQQWDTAPPPDTHQQAYWSPNHYAALHDPAQHMVNNALPSPHHTAQPPAARPARTNLPVVRVRLSTWQPRCSSALPGRRPSWAPAATGVPSRIAGADRGAQAATQRAGSCRACGAGTW